MSDIDSDFHIYPNPASDFVNLRSKKKERVAIFQIRDWTGLIKVEQIIKMDKNEVTLSIQNLPTGIYVYDFWTENSTPISGKLIVIK